MSLPHFPFKKRSRQLHFLNVDSLKYGRILRKTIPVFLSSGWIMLLVIFLISIFRVVFVQLVS